jgi:hypothetical protein
MLLHLRDDEANNGFTLGGSFRNEKAIRRQQKNMSGEGRPISNNDA